MMINKVAILLGILMVVTGCYDLIVDPPAPVTITAGIISDEVKEVLEEGTLKEVTFYAKSSPADTIYWQLHWEDFDFVLDYGVGEPNSYEGDYRLTVPLEYPASLMFHISFVAWGPKADTVRVTFINDPE